MTVGDRHLPRTPVALAAQDLRRAARGDLPEILGRGDTNLVSEAVMAHLWVHASGSDGGQATPDDWSLMPLDTDTFIIPGPGSAQLLRRTAPEGDAWILIGSPAAHVNGNPLDAGIRVLRDRDELRVD